MSVRYLIARSANRRAAAAAAAAVGLTAVPSVRRPPSLCLSLPPSSLLHFLLTTLIYPPSPPSPLPPMLYVAKSYEEGERRGEGERKSERRKEGEGKIARNYHSRRFISFRPSGAGSSATAMAAASTVRFARPLHSLLSVSHVNSLSAGGPTGSTVRPTDRPAQNKLALGAALVYI